MRQKGIYDLTINYFILESNFSQSIEFIRLMQKDLTYLSRFIVLCDILTKYKNCCILLENNNLQSLAVRLYFNSVKDLKDFLNFIVLLSLAEIHDNILSIKILNSCLNKTLEKREFYREQKAGYEKKSVQKKRNINININEIAKISAENSNFLQDFATQNHSSTPAPEKLIRDKISNSNKLRELTVKVMQDNDKVLQEKDSNSGGHGMNIAIDESSSCTEISDFLERLKKNQIFMFKNKFINSPVLNKFLKKFCTERKILQILDSNEFQKLLSLTINFDFESLVFTLKKFSHEQDNSVMLSVSEKYLNNTPVHEIKNEMFMSRYK